MVSMRFKREANGGGSKGGGGPEFDDENPSPPCLEKRPPFPGWKISDQGAELRVPLKLLNTIVL